MASPQVETIRKHLLEVGSISDMEARGVYGIRALPRRIKDLKLNYPEFEIQHVQKQDLRGQRYVRYVVANAPVM
jgi:hypothetical protein